MAGSGDENVFGLDVAMEEVMRVNVFEALHNLEEDALHTSVIETLVVASLHQLVEVPLHVLHGDMELLSERIQEDVKGGNQVRMWG
jgi:hypothetical protein